MTTNPPNAIDREQLQANNDAALRSLGQSFPELPDACREPTDEELRAMREGMVGGWFLREIER